MEIKIIKNRWFNLVSIKASIFMVFLLLVAASISELSANEINFTKKEKIFLITEFKSEKFSWTYLRKIFGHQKLKKIPIVINKNIVNLDPVDHYKDFLSPYSIYQANRFLKRWRTLLKRASQKYLVNKEVIVAVLLVETGLGNIMGDYPVISVFSSIIIEYENRKIKMTKITQPTERQQYELKRLSHKDRWARSQMKALLTIIKRQKQNPFYYKGSYAGAFGIPQFLPTSYLKWGVDSDNSGSVNLYWYPDAIYSVANYLKKHGWKPGLDRKSQEKVIWEYNHSKTYVNTVLNAARKLMKRNEKYSKK
jgi:membrane-bound lytic murein transglycosylase B